MAELGYPYYALGISMLDGNANASKSLTSINLPTLDTTANRDATAYDLNVIGKMFTQTTRRTFKSAKLTTTEEVSS